MPSELKDKCGVFGIWGPEDGSHRAYYALFAQQHRGQESAGIAVTDGHVLDVKTGMGLVRDVFSARDLDNLKGIGAIGHNRYSTTGSSHAGNAQPLLQEFSAGQVAIGHNGNLINAGLLRQGFEDLGHIFHTTTDTEVVYHLLAAPNHADKADPLYHALQHLQGAYCLVLLYKDRLEAVRDPWGFRPLVLGKTKDGYDCVASESVALDAIGATTIREVEPGEIVTLSNKGVQSRRFSPPVRSAHCVFEHVYFANPSSRVFGDTVQIVRERFGEQMAKEAPVEADFVMPMPDSGRSAAMGYARFSGLPLREGIVPNRYVGRTFIQPTQTMRDQAVQLKLNVVADVVRGQRIVVVDDSIVRGTTTKGKMDQLRRAGAKEIHFRISCPPLRHPCYMGIDFPDSAQLIANNRSIEEIRDFIGVDSLAYLTLDGMLECVSKENDHYCTACFSGDYRLDVEHPISKLELEKYQLKMFK
ncbi:MAG: amidophosphoribosyltransferase [Planctomycetota bacterium]|jgi:amidophosphoribosyltransferase